MKRGRTVLMLAAACLLLLYGCTQGMVSPSAKAVRIKVPNLMSG